MKYIRGTIFILMGITFGAWSLTYNIGTMTEMGTGFMPLAFSIVLVVLGIYNFFIDD